MRFCFLLILGLLLKVQIFAQPATVRIGVNGLTCSQCTRNVEMQLRKLDFVTDVKMNLQHTNGMVTLDAKRFDPSEIAGAVKAAGFSLRFMEMETGDLPSEKSFRIGNSNYELISTENKVDGASAIRFLNAQFLSASEHRKWKPFLPKNRKANVYYLAIVKKTVDS